MSGDPSEVPCRSPGALAAPSVDGSPRKGAGTGEGSDIACCDNVPQSPPRLPDLKQPPAPCCGAIAPISGDPAEVPSRGTGALAAPSVDGSTREVIHIGEGSGIACVNVPPSSPAPDLPYTVKEFEEEADSHEQGSLEDLLSGHISEEVLRDALDYYRDGRIELGTRPSKIREIHIVEARLEIAKSHRLLQGAVASSTPCKPTAPAARRAKNKKR